MFLSSLQRLRIGGGQVLRSVIGFKLVFVFDRAIFFFQNNFPHNFHRCVFSSF